MGRFVNGQMLVELRQILSEKQVFGEEPMARHTTFRVGGPAEVLVQPEGEQVSAVLDWCNVHRIPYTVIGNGSNLLVSDRGLSGVVIEFGKPASGVRIEGCSVYAEAGAMLSKVANDAAHAGLTGLEFASGIPGTIGGAVFMNAGAYGGEMSRIIREVLVLTPEGEKKKLSAKELDMGYRHSCIQEKGYIVLSAVLELEAGDKEEILAAMEDLKRKRIEKQPLEYPSAGSTFKRPQGYFAGKLIMDAGLKGYEAGGAAVSEKHCGFIVNKGGATAADIVAVMQHVQEEVKRQFDVTLEAEVRKLGEFA